MLHVMAATHLDSRHVQLVHKDDAALPGRRPKHALAPFVQLSINDVLRDRERDRERDRDRDRDRDRERERERDRHTDTDTHTERERERETNRQRERGSAQNKTCYRMFRDSKISADLTAT